MSEKKNENLSEVEVARIHEEAKIKAEADIEAKKKAEEKAKSEAEEARKSKLPANVSRYAEHKLEQLGPWTAKEKGDFQRKVWNETEKAWWYISFKKGAKVKDTVLSEGAANLLNEQKFNSLRVYTKNK